MKEKIYEEYGYNVEYLVYKSDYVCFEINDFKYMLYKVQIDDNYLNILDMIVNYLESYGIFFHQIISGKNGYLFEYGDEKYVLIKPRIVSEREINIDEIIRVSSISVNFVSPNLLSSKIDFLEQYLTNYEKLDLENINYFIGLSENAIALFNIFGSDNKRYVCHRRIKHNEKAVDFYNPLNIVLDYKTRDLAEYVKSQLLHGNNKMIEMLNRINQNDWYLYFARILFPSLYFDSVDKYIKFGIKMDKKRISELANSFEKSIKELYFFMSKYINMPYISWLIDVNNF